jgi:hypothetical protein
VEFEHLLEVDDDPAAPVLDRAALWFGLLCRAEDARLFLPGLDRCRITARSALGLTRELHFGSVVIRDRVRWEAPHWIRFESDATAGHVGGSLTISIEERNGALFLRFCYRTGLPEADDGEGYAGFVRSAYYQSDLDTLRVIRELAAAGFVQDFVRGFVH